MTNPIDYGEFLTSASAAQWRRIGIQKRSGVATPLFSVYSSESIGIGEIPDLKLLADWCRKTGMSIIQLLPMNDVGFEFRPYDAQSSFALDPMYLALGRLRKVALTPFKKDIAALRKRYPAAKDRVDYGVKGAKLELLWKIFQACKEKKLAGLEAFEEENRFWIRDYALYKALKEKFRQAGWESWDEPLKCRHEAALADFEREYAETIFFHKWLQWQLAEQFKEAKEYAKAAGVFLMGDLPFLVSRDSADVWSHQDYFKLDLVSGAPPDDYYAQGQRWGMPPYRWDNIERNRYDYPVQKVRYAENFYDFFRIDHVVGVFRLWSIETAEPLEHEGRCGRFDPADESLWEEHGRKILKAWISNTRMLPCAEDLGTVPDCSYRVLAECGIPGINVQRWTKNWTGDCSFTAPEKFRKNSIAVISTHDSSSFHGWWEFEAGTVDQIIFKRLCENAGIPFDQVRGQLFDLEASRHGRLRWKDELRTKEDLLAVLKRDEREVSKIVGDHKGSYREKEKFWEYVGMPANAAKVYSAGLVEKAMQSVLATASIFSIQLLQDWLCLDAEFLRDAWDFRINFPGTMNERNWTLVQPMSLEAMLASPVCDKINSLNRQAGRV
jgi:4-alpha-glucanotransferase